MMSTNNKNKRQRHKCDNEQMAVMKDEAIENETEKEQKPKVKRSHLNEVRSKINKN